MIDLKQHIVAVPDFPAPGILLRDIMPLLKVQFEATIAALERAGSAHSTDLCMNADGW